LGKRKDAKILCNLHILRRKKIKDFQQVFKDVGGIECAVLNFIVDKIFAP
jgi:hypothetical protein